MTWASRIGAITLFVEDLAEAQRFYVEVFELPVHFQDDDSVVFDVGGTLINLLRVEAAPELIAPRAVADPAAGTRAQLTLPVDDVDVLCATLVARGVTLINGPLDRPWGVRTACFADPGGHVWEVAAPLPSRAADAEQAG